MNWKRSALLPLALALTACAADGGSRGSGISTVVQGNVQHLQTAAPGMMAGVRALLQPVHPALAQATVAGISITVEGTAAHGETDGAGQFILRGDFEGHQNLVFQTPDGGTAGIAIYVPAAGTLTLHNLLIDTQNGNVSAESEDVEFDGLVAATDCPSLTLTMVSAQQTSDADQYTVHTDTASIHDQHGAPLPCDDLRVGDRAMVQGIVNPDGSFGDAVVEVEGK